MYLDGRKQKYYHRYLAQKFIPNPENKPEVNHIDGNKSNYDLSNLEWVTGKENRQHALETGLWGQNILNKRKLSWEQVEEIRGKYIPFRYSMKKLATEYFVDYKTIWDLLNNKTYIKTKGGCLGM
jgi:hypothetical protein